MAKIMNDSSPLDRAVPGLVQRTPEWLAARRSGIGGSDAAAVLGLSPWRTPFEVWAEKAGYMVPAEFAESEPMRWGRLLEPIILTQYERRRDTVVTVVGMLRHPDIPWLICSPDGVAGDRIVEVKTTRSAAGWGEQGTDEIPPHHLVQAHHNLIVSGAAVCDMPVLIGGSDERLYHVEPDQTLHAQILEQEADFWHAVERREPPPPKNVGDAVRRWGRASRPGAILANPDIVSAVEMLRAIAAQVKEGEALADELKMKIMAELGDKGDTLIDDAGRVLASWKLDKGRAGYTVGPKEPSRRFLLKGE